MKITKKQKEVLDFIKTYIEESGYSPTQNEIKDHFNLKSLGSVQDYIKYLKNAGFLVNDANSVRGLTINEAHKDNNISDIPLFGKVAAGNPIEACFENESIQVPTQMVGKFNCFALQVEGLSMINDGILDGDTIVIRSQNHANNGDTIVATIDNEATVKRFYKKTKNEVELHPANSSMSPIIVKGQQFEIKGVVVGPLRFF